MARVHGLDYLFAEPSGIAIPFELRNAILMAGRDSLITPGPVVLLLDGERPREAFIKEVIHITSQQLVEADVVAVTKTDTAAPDEISQLSAAIERVAPGVVLHQISLATGEGVPALLQLVL